MEDVTIESAGTDRIDELEPLWVAMHEHHRAVSEEIPGIPLRSAADSWRLRRAEYLEWLARPGSFLYVAEGPEGVVGYALVTTHDAPDDTNVTADRWAELQSLSVSPWRRGAGLGSRLLETVYEELRRQGVTELAIGVFASNADAIRLYERQGFRPWVVKMLGRIPDRP